jgi:hypothetical protein
MLGSFKLILETSLDKRSRPSPLLQHSLPSSLDVSCKDVSGVFQASDNRSESFMGFDTMKVKSSNMLRSFDQNNASTTSREITLDILISLQASEGFFVLHKPSPLWDRFQSQDNVKIENEIILCLQMAGCSGNKDTTSRIFDTILIIVFIQAQYPESAGLWELVVRKARSWILSQVSSNEEVAKNLEQIAHDNVR